MKIICTYLALFMVLAAQSQTNKKVEKLKERKELINNTGEGGIKVRNRRYYQKIRKETNNQRRGANT